MMVMMVMTLGWLMMMILGHALPSHLTTTPPIHPPFSAQGLSNICTRAHTGLEEAARRCEWAGRQTASQTGTDMDAQVSNLAN